MPSTIYTVTGAKGAFLPDGMLTWSGVLCADNRPFALFNNEGRGGCNTYEIRPDWDAEDEWFSFKVYAASRHNNLEPEDAEVGLLWDAAMLAKENSQ
jgi:hypothetical protein